MQTSMLITFLLACGVALHVTASAPRCQFKYVKPEGLLPPSGCPDSHWTDCCIVPMSEFDSQHPREGNYTGVCAVEPHIQPGMPDICKKLSDRQKDGIEDPILFDWTLQ
ncbi:uncharacterized protein SPSC_02960 [Sporisorium scitamineum]|uniref:Uncharacterized protein n=1 Tax=Sporisorium scitamineum TaxID=49012 RepID=A0A0F7RSY3_9BASI|nr:hypothetical protein [Sporisorium scitamineum]CDS82140.1 uncharacterized protein SPSC_02960 [Sporisorium scitamineum]